MQLFGLCILSILTVLGFVSLVKELAYGRLHPSEITFFTCNNENDIEYVIRCAKKSFPDAVIKVIDCGSADATAEIARRMGCRVVR